MKESLRTLYRFLVYERYTVDEMIERKWYSEAYAVVFLRRWLNG